MIGSAKARASRLDRAIRQELGFLRDWLSDYGGVSIFLLLLGLCWCLGGASRNNAEVTAALELIALAALCVAPQRRNALARIGADGQALLPLAGLVALVCLQLVPLPWSVWAALPGHADAARGALLLGLPKSPHGISLTPEDSLSALLKFIPATAILVLGLRLERHVLFAAVRWASLVVGVASTIFAFVQLTSASAGRLNPYSWTPPGAPAGVFANINHQATLLLMCLPFTMVIFAQARRRWRTGEQGIEPQVFLGVAAAIMVAGVAIAGSLAGYILLPFVFAFSIMFVAGSSHARDWRLVLAGAGLAIGAIFFAIGSPQLAGAGNSDYFGGDRARSGIHTTTLRAAATYFPFGSGLGSFEDVYPLFEAETSVEPTYVNHAHNDYLEILLELGLPGLALTMTVLALFARAMLRIWRTHATPGSFGETAKAACLAVTVVLVHSLVDYPLRTNTVACFVAAYAAVIIRASNPTRTDRARPGTSL